MNGLDNLFYKEVIWNLNMVIFMFVMFVYKLVGIGCFFGKVFINEILYYIDGEVFCLYGSSMRFVSKVNKLNVRNKWVIFKEILMVICVVCNVLMKKEEKICKCYVNLNNLVMLLDKLKV